MYSIWKYNVEPNIINQEYYLPEGAQIVSFGLDPADNMCFWARVNTNAPKVARMVACVGTGWPLDNVYSKSNGRQVEFIGSLTHGPYVGHLFDLGECVNDRIGG